jgi:hypothetical protein
LQGVPNDAAPNGNTTDVKGGSTPPPALKAKPRTTPVKPKKK